MTFRQVEAVWIWLYGTAAQKATYGRFNENGKTGGFSKDYLQVPKDPGTLLKAFFPPGEDNKHWLHLRSPGGIVERGFVSHSGGRAHLAWERGRPPTAWRMDRRPSAIGPNTIPGNPLRTNIADALRELNGFGASGIAGYLVAVKVFGEKADLHLRVYLDAEPDSLAFADVGSLPQEVRPLLNELDERHACTFASFDESASLYFDSASNHDAWSKSPSPSSGSPISDDAAAEGLPADEDEVALLEQQLADGDYSAPDVVVTSRSRGSQQRAFANAVKKNYGYRCAVTGISSVEFLVASHIVPWAVDQSIRLDPGNGICLSTLVDRAFDAGFITIDANCIAHVHQEKIGEDDALRSALKDVDGKQLASPTNAPPRKEHLKRRLDGLET